MSARVYLPILGRFLQVDPVEGGTDNNYVYANDPVNEFDLDGRVIPVFFLLGSVARMAAPHIARAAVKYIAKPIAKFAAKRAVPLLKKGAGHVARWGVNGARKFANGVRKAWSYVRSFRVNIKVDPAVGHRFGRGRHFRSHIQINVYRKGVSGSHRSIRFPIPFSKKFNQPTRKYWWQR